MGLYQKHQTRQLILNSADKAKHCSIVGLCLFEGFNNISTLEWEEGLVSGQFQAMKYMIDFGVVVVAVPSSHEDFSQGGITRVLLP